jgi:acetylornithine/N-succinyldiaminopimelate aminotransferase
VSNSADIIERTDRYTTPNYARSQVVFVRGQGRRLWDADGRCYLDLLAGIGVASLGYGHPAVVRAIQEQAERLLHTSNLFYHEPGADLAERLVENTFADRVFFCNSGAEANEAAIKMARRAMGDRHEIITVENSFHGRTLGALAATGQGALQEGFGPMPDGFIHVGYGDASNIAARIGAHTAAVMLEPVLGEGGVVVPPPGYLQAVRKLCDDAGVLLILDEVQTGNGRSGRLYAHELSDITPDILTTAKGLAGGLPIGAVLATEETGQAFVPGTHGSTFGANPVAAAAAVAVIDALKGGVIDNVVAVSKHLRAGLEKLAATREDIVEVRGLGLMLGIEFTQPTKPIVAQLLAEGVIANATAGNVLRLLPPLTLTIAEADEALGAIHKVLP